MIPHMINIIWNPLSGGSKIEAGAIGFKLEKTKQFRYSVFNCVFFYVITSEQVAQRESELEEVDNGRQLLQSHLHPSPSLDGIGPQRCW